MEFFNTKDTKKKFDDLIHVIIPSLNECGNCGVEKCVYCTKFVVICNMCRSSRCSKCAAFKNAKKILMEKCNKQTQEYLANFLNDFFRISDITANFFNLQIMDESIKEKNSIFLDEKELKKHSNFLKNYVNNNNNNKVNYIFKGRKRKFFS